MLLVIFTTILLTETFISPSMLFLNTATAGQTSNSTKFNLRNFLILLQAIFSFYSTVAFTINWWSSYGLSFNRLVLRRRNTRNRNSQLVAQLCFVVCFGSMFAFFNLRLSTCRVTKIFVLGWRTLLRKVDRGSILSYKCWPCCSFSSNSQLVMDPYQAFQPISVLHFIVSYPQKHIPVLSNWIWIKTISYNTFILFQSLYWSMLTSRFKFNPASTYWNSLEQ